MVWAMRKRSAFVLALMDKNVPQFEWSRELYSSSNVMCVPARTITYIFVRRLDKMPVT
jgi:hypothetical protein